MKLQLPDGITVEDLIEVSGLGDTVWVNAPDGSCIGRFAKRFGIDVHRTLTAQMEGMEQCLFCTHEAAGPNEWEQFRAAILEHYGINVPENTITFDGPRARRKRGDGSGDAES